MIGNRLRKNLARLGPWARREGLQAWRVYDRDIPDRPWLVDLYGDHALISEYVTPVGRSQALEQQASEQQEVSDAVAEVLNVPIERQHFKVRQRHRSVEREASGNAAHELVVEERGRKFLVNLDDYLDTGLFLDHRAARQRVAAAAAGKRVLNLFCYTGAFSVHAAANGAVSTVGVDLSKTYLDWAGRNLALNGLPVNRNELVRADVVEFLRREGRSFDVVVLDPPTLSRSREARSFDVQKDHRMLIELTMKRVSAGGWLLFSTNFRQFQLDPRVDREYSIREISADTAPRDFREPVHRAWEIRHVDATSMGVRE